MKKLLVFLFIAMVLTGSTHKQITWVAIGDSITYLGDHPEETKNRVSKGYMQIVCEKLPFITYVNKGYSGWTSEGIAKQFETLNIPKGDVYSIFLGTNDWWQGRAIGTLDDYKNNTGNGTINGSFRMITDKIRALNSDAKIFLITPMQRVDFVWLFGNTNNAYGSYKEKNGQTLLQVVNAINAIGAYEHFKVADLYNKSGMTHDKLVKYKRVKDPATGTYKNFKYPDFIDIPFNPQTDEYPYPADAADYTYDGLHPSDKGYDKIAKLVYKVIKKY
jgi:lysophospholipase L1-like esterase